MSTKIIIAAATVSVAAIAGVATFLIKRGARQERERNADREANLKRDLAERTAAAAEHAHQMATNPEYAEVHRKAQVANAERATREAAERAEAALVRERHFNSPEALAQRERERLIKLEENLIRERSRERDEDLARMERMYHAANNHCNCGQTCGC